MQNACEMFTLEISREESASEIWASWFTFDSQCIGSSGGVRPIILNFGTRWSSVASFTPRSLCSQYAPKKNGGVDPSTGPDTSETPCGLDSSRPDV